MVLSTQIIPFQLQITSCVGSPSSLASHNISALCTYPAATDRDMTLFVQLKWAWLYRVNEKYASATKTKLFLRALLHFWTFHGPSPELFFKFSQRKGDFKCWASFWHEIEYEQPHRLLLIVFPFKKFLFTYIKQKLVNIGVFQWVSHTLNS